MDIQINLLPEELRPRPPVETRTMLLVFLMVALLAGSVFLYMAKSSAESEGGSMEERIAAVDQEVNTLSSNAEAVALSKSITNLKAAEKSYSAFVSKRIDWGDALDRVNALVPQGIQLNQLTQTGKNLEVEGTASNYSAVASFGRSLDIDRMFTLTGVPYLNGSDFSLVVAVAAGGGS